jgi:hypothetical protein
MMYDVIEYKNKGQDWVCLMASLFEISQPTSEAITWLRCNQPDYTGKKSQSLRWQGYPSNDFDILAIFRIFSDSDFKMLTKTEYMN